MGLYHIYLGIYPGLKTFASVCEGSLEFLSLPNVLRQKDYNCAGSMLGRSRVS